MKKNNWIKIALAMSSVFLFSQCEKSATLVPAPTGVKYTPSYIQVTQGMTGQSNTPTVEWGGTQGTFKSTYLPLSNVFSVVANTGVIKWTTTATTTTNTYTVKVVAENSGGKSTEASYMVYIAPIAGPTLLAYAPSTTEIFVGATGHSVTPTINWGDSIGNFRFSTATPTGITIDTKSGVITWANTLSSNTYTFKVVGQNSFGTSNEVAYTLIVSPAPQAPSSLAYVPSSYQTTKGTAGQSAVPTVNWGGQTGTFKLTSSATTTEIDYGITGISINATTGVLSWANTLETNTYTLKVLAENTVGASNEFVYTLDIGATAVAPSSLVYATSSVSNPYGTAGQSVIPTVNWGGSTGTFEISSTPVTGISINATTGIISWANTLGINTYNIKVIAKNSVGSSSEAAYTLAIQVAAPSSVAYSTNSANITVGTAGQSVVPTVNWGGATGTFAFTSAAVTGININATTGVISWDNTVAVGTYNLKVMATNSGGSSSEVAYTLVVSQVAAPSSVAYSTNSANITVGTAGQSVVPTVNWGGATGTFAFTSAAVTGISINATTGVISWANTVVAGTYNLKVVAINTGGSSSEVAYTVVVSQVLAPSSVAYSSNSANITVGTSGQSVVPTVNWGGATGTFAFTSAAVTGISINATTGVISWANTVVAGTYNLKVVATNTGGSSTEVAYTVVAAASTSSSAWQDLITEAFWNDAFPNRAGVGYTGQGYTTDFYSYTNLKNAIIELQNYKLHVYTNGTAMKIVKENKTNGVLTEMYKDDWYSDAGATEKIADFMDFINTGNTTNNKRELCAFLANIAKETTGGWTLPVGGGQSGDYALWGLCFVYESGHTRQNCGSLQYREPASTYYPPTAGICYHGRGPIQTSWNYNFGRLSLLIYDNKQTLLDNPDKISEDGKLAFMAGIEFWMTPSGSKPSCHEVMQETWVPTKTYASSKMNKKGFAHANNIINGGLECRTFSDPSFALVKPPLRAGLYKYYMKKYGFTDAEIANEDTGNYTTLCYESSSNAMEDY